MTGGMTGGILVADRGRGPETGGAHSSDNSAAVTLSIVRQATTEPIAEPTTILPERVTGDLRGRRWGGGPHGDPEGAQQKGCALFLTCLADGSWSN